MGVKRFSVLLAGLFVLVGLCATGAYAGTPPAITRIAIEKPDTTVLINGMPLLGINGQIRVRVETFDPAQTVRVRVLTSKNAATGANTSSQGWGSGAFGTAKVVTGLDTTAIDSVQIGGVTVEKALARVSGQETTTGKVLTAFMTVKVAVGQVDSCIIEARTAATDYTLPTTASNNPNSPTQGLNTSLDGVFIGSRPRFTVDGDRPSFSSTTLDSIVIAGKAGVSFPNTPGPYPAGSGSPGSFARNDVVDTVGVGKTLQFTVGLGTSATQLINALTTTAQANPFLDVYAIAVRADTLRVPTPWYLGYQRDFSNARIKVDLSADDVVNQSKRSVSYSVVEGKFGDFQRIVAEAFVIDRAGNLSSAAGIDSTPSGVTSSYTMRIDDKYPKFTYSPGSLGTSGTRANKVTYPDSTGQSFTGGSAAVYDTIKSDGTLVNAKENQFPLKFKIDESLDSLSIRLGDGGLRVDNPIGGVAYVVDSRRIANTLKGYPVITVSDGVLSQTAPGPATPTATTGSPSLSSASAPGTAAILDTRTTAATGTAGARVDTAAISTQLGSPFLGLADGTYNLRYKAYDFAGNVKDTTISSVVYDRTPIEFKGRFPAKGAVDTINAATSQLVFTLSEAADSLRVTYRQIISGTIGRTVTTYRGLGGGDTSIDLNKTTSEQRISVNTDSLSDGRSYTLQVFGRDKVGNFTAVGPDTLFYKVAFQNPNADTIRVTVYPSSNDTVVVSQSKTYDTTKTAEKQFGILFIVTAVDTVLKSRAITYNQDNVLLDVWSPDSTANLIGVHVAGTGVTEQVALVGGKRRAILSKSGWVLGSRLVTVTDTLAQSRLYVTVQDTISTVKKRGQSQALVFEAGAMTKYKLMVADASKVSTVVDTTEVAANKTFILNVQPQDQWGNPSLKNKDDIYTGTKGGIASSPTGGDALGEIYLEFASSGAPVGVPPGPQRLNSTGWYAFEFEAPNENAMFRISARTANTAGGSQSTTGTGAYTNATGHTWIRTSGAGGVVGPPPPTGDPTVTKPDTLIVEDYKGPDGSGDQGGFVLVTFKNTAQHAQLAQYRIWRELQVSVNADTTGKIITLATPLKQWVPWAVVDAVPVLKGQTPISRAVIPTIDNIATRWAITAELGSKSSEAATSSAVGSAQGKVVFSPESVKETLALLGIQSAMPAEEILKVFGPSYEYARSVLGDQKDLLLGTLDLDGLRRVAMRVPEGVRAQSAKIRASDATAAAAAVRAIDNLPPAAVADEKEAHTDKREVTLTWSMSKDDRIVGLIPYRGYAVPIPGVRTYDVFRGKGEDEKTLVKVTSLAAGSTTFKDVVSPDLGDKVIYRITATDLDNATPGKLVTVTFAVPVPVPVGRIKYLTADGKPVYLMLDPKDPNFSLTEGFNDFFVFADNFGKSKGAPGFNLQADINDDGKIDFDDFFLFAEAFGKTAVQPKAGKLVARAAPVSGVNRDAGLNLNLVSERVIAGQQINLDVAISNAAALKGYGFTLTYDPQKFELVEVTAGDQNLLSQGGNTPVFLKNTQPGRIQVANAIAGDGAVVGSGNVARLVFNVKGEFDDIARFEIAEGILVDGSRLLNPVVTLGALNIQTTPTEFTLKQNFPNPFNPETTIKYNLAASGPVELRIYNMVGQVVRALVNERQAAGRYSIRWDGKDDHGLSVSSGIYFYRIDTDKFHSVKKLMLLK